MIAWNNVVNVTLKLIILEMFKFFGSMVFSWSSPTSIIVCHKLQYKTVRELSPVITALVELNVSQQTQHLQPRKSERAHPSENCTCGAEGVLANTTPSTTKE